MAAAVSAGGGVGCLGGQGERWRLGFPAAQRRHLKVTHPAAHPPTRPPVMARPNASAVFTPQLRHDETGSGSGGGRLREQADWQQSGSRPAGGKAGKLVCAQRWRAGPGRRGAVPHATPGPGAHPRYTCAHHTRLGTVLRLSSIRTSRRAPAPSVAERGDAASV